jgi:hypothetical protein
MINQAVTILVVYFVISFFMILHLYHKLRQTENKRQGNEDKFLRYEKEVDRTLWRIQNPRKFKDGEMVGDFKVQSCYIMYNHTRGLISVVEKDHPVKIYTVVNTKTFKTSNMLEDLLEIESFKSKKKK